jgi:hypothetical protein
LTPKLLPLGEVTSSGGAGAAGMHFTSVLRESVLLGLSDVLGSAGARAAFYHLKLPESATAAEVHTGLVRIFGMGTQSLESSILSILYAKVGMQFDPEESMTFADYVGIAMKASLKTRVK